MMELFREKFPNGVSCVEDVVSNQVVREMEMQLEQTKLDLETYREAVRKETENYNICVSQLELSRQEVITPMPKPLMLSRSFFGKILQVKLFSLPGPYLQRSPTTGGICEVPSDPPILLQPGGVWYKTKKRLYS